MTDQEPPSDNNPRPFVLRRRKRVPVETTLGQYFARHIITSDLPIFARYVNHDSTGDDTDFEQLGKTAVMRLVCVDEGRDSAPAFNDESFATLTDTDLATTVRAVAQACEVTGASDISTLDALGSALFPYLSALAKQEEESRRAIRQSIETNFGNLPSTVQAALGDKMSALSAARKALGTSTAVEAAQAAIERQTSLVRNAIAGLPRVGDAIASPTRPLIADITPFRPPKFEETVAGKTAARAATASEESAKQLTEVAGLMGTMAEQMAGLQTVFLSEVLPQWVQNLEDGANATRTTLRQAETSLSWAKWALVASVVVSIAMTGWQVWLAREYKLENDKQQENTELLLRQQLKAAQDLNAQLQKLSLQPRENPQPSKVSQDKGNKPNP